MNREEHGKARAGKITGTLAHTVMYGGAKAWATAITNLWADDGSDYAKATTGARAHGIEYEAVGASLFWERHPELDISDGGFHLYRGHDEVFRGMLGVSPDRLVGQCGIAHAGLEIKSPTSKEKMAAHIPKNSDPRSNPHHSQAQHGMLVLGLPAWWHVVHCEGEYWEMHVDYDIEWIDRYRQRLRAFILQYEGSKPQPRRKLSILDDE